MSKTSRDFALLMFVVALLILVFDAPRTQGTAIIRSKSNICNNRRALPMGGGPESGPGDVVVLCESCTYPGLPEEGCLVLMDNQTGEIWAYSDDAVVGNVEPKFLGRLPAVGKRMLKTPYSPPK